jgi:hypothetical protein
MVDVGDYGDIADILASHRTKGGDAEPAKEVRGVRST